jgi:hypothetical protein
MRLSHAAQRSLGEALAMFIGWALYVLRYIKAILTSNGFPGISKAPCIAPIAEAEVDLLIEETRVHKFFLTKATRMQIITTYAWKATI